MTSENRLLSLPEMQQLLAEVDKALEGQLPPGTVYNLYAIGGIAMAAATNDRRLTVDIDVVTQHIPKAVMDAVRDVAIQHRLNDNWVNNQVAEMVNADLPPSCFQDVYRGKNLVIAGAKPDCLLALKLMSGRGKDLEDIIKLSTVLGVTTPTTMLEVCDDIFADTPSWPVQRYFVDQVCQDVAPIIRKHIAGEGIDNELEVLIAHYEGENGI